MISAFMEKNPEVAKSYNPTTASGRVTQKQKWEQLARSLNNNGPPTKSVAEWKRVWTVRKYSIKKKLTYNKNSIKKTGGGPFDLKPLDDAEEAIVNACGLEASVSGIVGSSSFGASENKENINDDSLEELFYEVDTTPESGSKNISQEASKTTIPSTPKTKKKGNDDLIIKQLELQEHYFSQQNQFSKEANGTLMEIRDAIRELGGIRKAEMEAAYNLKNEELKMRRMELEVAKMANDIKLMEINQNK